MQTVFLVKKDPSIENRHCENNWEIMSYDSFMRFIRSDRAKGRYFSKLPSLYEGDTTYYIECDKSLYLSHEKERQRDLYRTRCARKAGLAVFPFLVRGDAEASDPGSHALYETVEAAEEEDVEQTVIEKLEVERLRAAVAKLNDRQRAVIYALYWREQPEQIRSIAARLGISRQTVHRLKADALQRLKQAVG